MVLIGQVRHIETLERDRRSGLLEAYFTSTSRRTVDRDLGVVRSAEQCGGDLKQVVCSAVDAFEFDQRVDCAAGKTPRSNFEHVAVLNDSVDKRIGLRKLQVLSGIKAVQDQSTGGANETCAQDSSLFQPLITDLGARS